MINGNIDGVKKSILEDLEKIYEIKMDKEFIVNEEIAQNICKNSCVINREISVIIDRRGIVQDVSIGDSNSVKFEIDVTSVGLSGVRLIHTHPNGNSKLSSFDESALLMLKLDACVAIACLDGEIKGMSVGVLSTYNDSLNCSEKFYDVDKFFETSFIDEILPDEKQLIPFLDKPIGEIAILVGTDTLDSLDELYELAMACELAVVDRVFQKKEKREGNLYIGKGKAAEVAGLRQLKNANLIIFDDELTGSELRNLEDAIGAKVIDRTTLILEIFARRAKTRESKIQVELAQLRYRSTRLSGNGKMMSRTGGGIGTKGPGEKKLEVDRRHIKERIYDLNKELQKIKATRKVQREQRTNKNICGISLVGYTNSGKSTLRNLLCRKFYDTENILKEDVLAKDMLFATLETTTRAIRTSENQLLTITDTVGFIKKLPHYLIESFKSTLEEVIGSDLLLHVCDVSSPNFRDEILTVEEILTELKCENTPSILVINKMDKVEEEFLENKISEIMKDSKYEYKSIIPISSLQDINIDILLDEIVKNIPEKLVKAKLLFPYENTKEASTIFRNGNVLTEEYRDDGIYYEAELDNITFNKMNKFII